MQPICPSNVSKILCSALFAFAVLVARGGAAATLDPEDWLREAEAAYDRVSTYTAVFHKQQRVAGKLLPEETIFLKCRKNPFSLYMNWIRAPRKGSEYGKNTQVLEVVFPKGSARNYAGHRYVINQDVESKILVRIRAYDQDNRLVENYGYEKLDLNAPLADVDFDPKNPEYHF